jgi:hypothetical protein
VRNQGVISMDGVETWEKIQFPGIGGFDKTYAHIRKWCEDYEGFGSYALGGHAVWFSSKEDAMVFALRWL